MAAKTKKVFQDELEAALARELAGLSNLEPADRYKVLNLAIKFSAVKARFWADDQGAGFEDVLDEEPEDG